MTEKLYPNNFIDGQKALNVLLSEVKNKTVSHGYILEGAKGIGKRTAALIFGAALCCEGQNKPCGVCGQCIKHAAGTHPDISIVEPNEKGNIRIEAIRAASDELFMRPKIADRKILIIDGADAMNAAAQNALLKSFEEPPSYGVVVLLSENADKLLPTIRSRGVKLRMEPFSTEKIKTYVEKEFPEFVQRSTFVANYSGGIVGRAKDICGDEDFFELRKEMFSALKALGGSKSSIFPVAEVFGCRGKMNSKTKDLAFEFMLSFFRDALMLKNGGRIINTDCMAEINDFSSSVTAAGLISAVEIAAETAAGLNVSMNYGLWTINMLIEIWGVLHGNGSRR